MPGMARVFVVLTVGCLLLLGPAIFTTPHPATPLAAAEVVRTQISPPQPPTQPPGPGQPGAGGMPDRQRFAVGTAGIVLIAVVLGVRRLRGKPVVGIKLKWKKDG